ncbi:MAG: UDP-3-O-(3-hydroxymyristoyl)glucosamine N-acyltransferase [Pseudomonadota bacterium]
MSENRDPDARGTYSLGEIAQRVGAELQGDAAIRIHGVAGLETAGPGQLSFLTNARYAQFLPRSKAAAVIVPPSLKDVDFARLVSEQPYLALARAAQLFAEPPFLAPGIHPSAHVGENATLGPDVSVGPLAHIGPDCKIGRASRIYGGAYIGQGVEIGEECLIYPGVTILNGCRLGNRAIIHSGTVIGSDGFGFAQDGQGHHVKIPQTGIVQIDDDVEIGANCTVDRAAFGRTWIQRGTKIDNLVQIAHNVVVGEHSILIAQVGISGSTRIGKHVVLAGQVGVAGHIEIGDRVRIGAKSGVPHSIQAGEDVLGIPAVPQKEWFKTFANVRRLGRLKEELRDLRKRVSELEKALHEE